MITSTSWGVLVAHYQQLKLVDESLTVYGVDHFIPKIETLLIVRGRHVREQRPLFGEYVLIAISSIWKSLIRIRGVSGILLNEVGMPAQVLAVEMEKLRAMCDGDVYRSSVIDNDGSGFEYGQKVTPREGPFVFHIGQYESRNKRGDLTAIFRMFGREQKVTFKSGDLLAV